MRSAHRWQCTDSDHGPTERSNYFSQCTATVYHASLSDRTKCAEYSVDATSAVSHNVRNWSVLNEYFIEFRIFSLKNDKMCRPNELVMVGNQQIITPAAINQSAEIRTTLHPQQSTSKWTYWLNMPILLKDYSRKYSCWPFLFY